jgi:uncharacterized glyoxalase superfamily protein PhnB
MSMTETVKKPTNAPGQEVAGGVIPYLMLEDSGAAGDFYKKAFGAIEVARIPTDDGKRLMHLHLRINGGSLMFTDGMPERGYPAVPVQGVMLHLQIADDIDTWWNRAVEAGTEVVMPLQVTFWGDRYGQLKDAFGVTWTMGSPNKG